VLTGLLCACDDPPQDYGLPQALPCTPRVTPGVDPSQGASFDPKHMLCVQVQMDAGDFKALRNQERFKLSGGAWWEETARWSRFLKHVGDCTRTFSSPFTWFSADVSVDGVKVSRVGIRKKGFLGSAWRHGLIKPSLKIDTDQLVNGQRLGETERLTLNNSLQDRSWMRTCLVHNLIIATGYPGARCNLANVMVNGQPLGVYAHLEPLKRPFLKRAFGDSSGSLYEAQLTDLVDVGLARFQSKTTSTDPAKARLRSLIQALKSPDSKLEQELSRYLNIDRFITFWALEALVNHNDGYGGNKNNYYIYFDPKDGNRATFLHWGMDWVMGYEALHAHNGEKGPELDYYLRGELTRRLSRIPAMAARFEKELARLLDKVWDEKALQAQVDHYEKQVLSGYRDREWEEEEKKENYIVNAVKDLRSWIKYREHLLKKILSKGQPRGGDASGTCVVSP